MKTTPMRYIFIFSFIYIPIADLLHLSNPIIFFSHATYHVMRDHPKHGQNIMGGMFGSRVNATLINTQHLKVLQTILHESTAEWKWGIDQQLLKKYLWPLVETDVVAHES